MIYQVIGDSITNNGAVTLLQSLYESKLITIRELEIMKMAVNDRTLSSAEERNKVRADVLKGMLMAILV